MASTEFEEALTSTPHPRRSHQLSSRALAVAQQHASLGRRLLESGRHGAAIDACRRALALRPDLGAAATTIGDALFLQGRLDEAGAMYGQAVVLDPDDAEARNGLGGVLLQTGKPKEAEPHFRRVLTRYPYHLSATLNLARALAEQSRLAEAVECCAALLASHPDFVTGHLALGMFLEAQGELAQAVAAYARATELAPELAEARARLAGAAVRLGDTQFAAGQMDEAAAAYEKALGLDGGLAEAHGGIGRVWLEREKPEQAEAAFRRALALAPAWTRTRPDAGIAAGYCALHLNLAHALIGQRKLDCAEASCREAIGYGSDSVEAHYLLGCVLRHAGRPEEAIEAYRHAIGLDPSHAASHWNLAMCLLLLGDYVEGWKEYEWRWKLEAEVITRVHHLPRWEGEALEGKTVLVTSEQGFGDTIQFARYARLVAERGGRVVLECQPALQRLLEMMPGVSAVVAQGELPPRCDLQVPLLSLPRIFETRLESVPNGVPYLSGTAHSPQPIAHCPRLEGATGIRIGLVWAGSPKPNPRRSCTLDDLAPLWEIQGITWYSLQVGPRAKDLEQPGVKTPLIDLSDQLTDFADTAAIISQLDLVITVDTAAAHLAGALGVPVWLLLIKVADWRWMLGREDCPWYPTMRLFRQREAGEWGEVGRRVGEALARFNEDHRRSAR